MRDVVEVVIEMTTSVLEGKWNWAIANFHDKCVDWKFFL